MHYKDQKLTEAKKVSPNLDGQTKVDVYKQLYSMCSLLKLLYQYEILGIVPFVAMPLQGRFVVFLGYIGLGDCPAGLGNWPRRVRAPCRAQKQEKSYCENTKNRHERDYTRNFKGICRLYDLNIIKSDCSCHKKDNSNMPRANVSVDVQIQIIKNLSLQKDTLNSSQFSDIAYRTMDKWNLMDFYF